MNVKRIALLLSLLAFCSCQKREYENPFLSEGGADPDRAWLIDQDGDGIADSVEFYAAGCTGAPGECLRRARTASEEARAQAVNPGVDSDPADSSGSPEPPADTSKPTVPVQPPKDTVPPVVPTQPPRDTVRDTVIIAPPRDTVIVTPPAVAVIGIQASAVFIPMGVASVTPPVSVLPRDARNQEFTLTSLDEKVVKVSGQNLVPMSPGVAKVRARSDEGGFMMEFEATVVARDSTVREVKVSVADMVLTVGDPSRAPEIAWTPVNVTQRGYSLKSSKPAIAAIVSEGGVEKCRALAAGESIVTFTSAGVGLVTTFKVTVKAAPILTLPVLAISAKDMILERGGPDLTPVVAYLPATATDKGYSLRSDKPGVVSVTVSGTSLHAVSGGKATITITSMDGPSGVFQATVRIHVDSVYAPALTLVKGSVAVPAVSFLPADADDKSYTLKSNDPEIVSVQGEEITAVSNGTAVITITAADGGVTGTFTVKVNRKRGDDDEEKDDD